MFRAAEVEPEQVNNKQSDSLLLLLPLARKKKKKKKNSLEPIFSCPTVSFLSSLLSVASFTFWSANEPGKSVAKEAHLESSFGRVRNMIIYNRHH